MVVKHTMAKEMYAVPIHKIDRALEEQKKELIAEVFTFHYRPNNLCFQDYLGKEYMFKGNYVIDIKTTITFNRDLDGKTITRERS